VAVYFENDRKILMFVLSQLNLLTISKKEVREHDSIPRPFPFNMQEKLTPCSTPLKRGRSGRQDDGQISQEEFPRSLLPLISTSATPHVLAYCQELPLAGKCSAQYLCAGFDGKARTQLRGTLLFAREL
jgi:hypothetical protein